MCFFGLTEGCCIVQPLLFFEWMNEYHPALISAGNSTYTRPQRTNAHTLSCK